MRLRRIEAIRYGGIDGQSVDCLGEGLSVVLGPNEAGKTSLISLVRHVLYGFPDKRTNERGYLSAGGAREGRLLFGADDGEWWVRRVDGVRGGQAGIERASGAERPDLVSGLTKGVDARTFRVVFGFGVDELAKLEELRRSGDDVVSRLLAVVAGLDVSPQAVRADLEKRAGDLWAKGASKPRANTLLREIRDAKAELAEIDAAAREVMGQRGRAVELEAALSDLDSGLLRMSTHQQQLAAARAAADEAATRLAELEESEADAVSTLSGIAAERASVVLDPAALDAADAVDGTLADLSAFANDRESLQRAMQQRDEAVRSLSALLAEQGWTSEQIASVAAGDDAVAVIDRARDDLAGLRTAAEAAAAAARVAGPAPAAAARRSSALYGWLAVGVGALAAVVGFLLGEWVAVALGAVVAVAGVVFALRARPVGGSVVAGADGLGEAAARRAEAETARAALDERAAEWAAWLASSGLPVSTDDPGAAAAVLRRVADARRLQRELEELDRQVSAFAARVEGFCERLATSAAFLPGAAGVDAASAETVAGRVREAVAAARAAQTELRELERREGEATRERDRGVAEAQRVRARACAAAEQAGLDGDCGAAEIAARLEQATREADAATTERDEVARELATLQERVRSAAKEDRAERLRLELAGKRERLAVSAEEHAVLSVALRLLAEAQSIYETKRQPEVVRAAEREFAAITGGRYVGVTMPLGEGAVRVTDTHGGVFGVDELSRGTTAQLYLALRLGLIEQLGDVGCGLPVLMDDVLVDFDPERIRSAAEAVARLAAHRQVVLFTCHPAIEELFAQVAPGHALVELG